MSTKRKRTYKDCVEDGKVIVLASTKNNWALGDLAIEAIGLARTHETNGGKNGGNGALKQYAEDIGWGYDRIKHYRTVASAWTEGTRVPSIPWTCYRTIYTATDREQIMIDYVTDCETRGIKPSYRSFQSFLGLTKTREYAKANAKEVAEQSLDDLDSDAVSDVIIPHVAKPEVAKKVIKNKKAKEAIRDAEAEEYLHNPDRELQGSTFTGGVSAALATIRIELRSIQKEATRANWPEDHREYLSDELLHISQLAETVAVVVRNPNATLLTEADFDALLKG